MGMKKKRFLIFVVLFLLFTLGFSIKEAESQGTVCCLDADKFCLTVPDGECDLFYPDPIINCENTECEMDGCCLVDCNPMEMRQCGYGNQWVLGDIDCENEYCEIGCCVYTVQDDICTDCCISDVREVECTDLPGGMVASEFHANVLGEDCYGICNRTLFYGNVTGTVFVQGTVTAGITVELDNTTSITDNNGNFSFTDVYAGQRILRATHAGYEPLREEIEVTEFETVYVRLDFLEEADYSPVEGNVTDSVTGLLMKDVVVTLFKDDFVRTAITGDDGSYVIGEVPLNTYTLTGTKPGYHDAEIFPFTITETGVTKIGNLQLDPYLTDCGDGEWDPGEDCGDGPNPGNPDSWPMQCDMYCVNCKCPRTCTDWTGSCAVYEFHCAGDYIEFDWLPHPEDVCTQLDQDYAPGSNAGCCDVIAKTSPDCDEVIRETSQQELQVILEEESCRPCPVWRRHVHL